jgi:hypothetical protein
MKYRGFCTRHFLDKHFLSGRPNKVRTRAGKLQVCLVHPQGKEAVNKALIIVNVGRYVKRLSLLLLIRKIPGSELGTANPFS